MKKTPRNETASKASIRTSCSAHSYQYRRLVAPSMRDPIVKRVHELVGDSSAPEIVEALLVIARHHERQLKRERNRESIGWKVAEAALAKALTAMEG